MGLDLYAGTLTRYYAHNWKTSVQQWAEENGYSFEQITPEENNNSEEEMSPAEILECMENWRDQILAAINQPEKSYAPWREDNEKPYFTDKPDWDAYGAMLLVAACYTYGEAVPATIAKNWNFSKNPLIERLSCDKENIWSLFRSATCYLPLQDNFMFLAPLPTGEQGMIATAAALREELNRINAMVWQADEDTICKWSRTEGYPVDGEADADGKINKSDIPDTGRYNTQSLAKFSFSVFYRALKFAEENQVPILLDY